MDTRIDRLREGVILDDGYRTLPAQVYRDSDTGLHTWFVVAIREGKNRQIRRMFETTTVTIIAKVHDEFHDVQEAVYSEVLGGGQ